MKYTKLLKENIERERKILSNEKRKKNEMAFLFEKEMNKWEIFDSDSVYVHVMGICCLFFIFSHRIPFEWCHLLSNQLIHWDWILEICWQFMHFEVDSRWISFCHRRIDIVLFGIIANEASHNYMFSFYVYVCAWFTWYRMARLMT